MSTEDRKKVELAATVIIALITLATALGTFVLLPYRMTAAETAITKVQEQRVTDHDLLNRIDVRTEEMKRILDRIDKTR